MTSDQVEQEISRANPRAVTCASKSGDSVAVLKDGRWITHAGLVKALREVREVIQKSVDHEPEYQADWIDEAERITAVLRAAGETA